MNKIPFILSVLSKKEQRTQIEYDINSAIPLAIFHPQHPVVYCL